MNLYLDFETRSEVDLKKVGTALYAEHPSTEILCVAFCHEIPDAVTLLLPDDFNGDYELFAPANTPDCIAIAHNASFEQYIWNAIMVKRYGYPPIPIERWKCTMAKALTNGLPASLHMAAKALNLPAQKDMEGRTNMPKLSKPRRNGKFYTPEDAPEEFEKLYAYCKQDVEVMRQLDGSLPDLSVKEKKIWQIDQRMNQEGVYVDLPLIFSAMEIYSVHDKSQQKLFRQITGGKPSVSRQRALVISWLASKGVLVANTQKVTFDKLLLRKDLPDNVRMAIKICSTAGKTSIGKFKKMLERATSEGNIRRSFSIMGPVPDAGQGEEFRSRYRQEDQSGPGGGNSST